MAIKKRDDLIRVTINLPKNIVDKVKDYSNTIGINLTSAYIVLINQGLEQRETLKSLPHIANIMNEFKALENIFPTEKK